MLLKVKHGLMFQFCMILGICIQSPLYVFSLFQHSLQSESSELFPDSVKHVSADVIKAESKCVMVDLRKISYHSLSLKFANIVLPSNMEDVCGSIQSDLACTFIMQNHRKSVIVTNSRFSDNFSEDAELLRSHQRTRQKGRHAFNVKVLPCCWLLNMYAK